MTEHITDNIPKVQSRGAGAQWQSTCFSVHQVLGAMSRIPHCPQKDPRPHRSNDTHLSDPPSPQTEDLVCTNGLITVSLSTLRFLH